MMKQAASIPFIPAQLGAVRCARSTLQLLIYFCLSFTQPLAAVAQTNAPAPVPPAAQEALNRGIIAATVPDYLLAIRFFEEARTLAPAAPLIHLNLGLAESRIPGRELRAIAWFSAYLAAYPAAQNAAAVREQIAVLDARNRSNVSRLIRSAQDAANQIGGNDMNQWHVARLWAQAGDIAAAVRTLDSMENDTYKDAVRETVAEAQIRAGDVAGAQATVDLILSAPKKSGARSDIARAQAGSGDIAGAQESLGSALKAAELIKNAYDKSRAQGNIADAQLMAGDIAGAQRTADLIQDASEKSIAQNAIAIAQANNGDIAGAQNAISLIPDAFSKRSAQESIANAQAMVGIAIAPISSRQTTTPIQSVITVSDWLEELDCDSGRRDCPLKKGPVVDLAGHLQSLRAVNDPQKVFESLNETASIILGAQDVVFGMLKQQATR
jgi:tetratricopeptide (TPR) repeat protein